MKDLATTIKGKNYCNFAFKTKAHMYTFILTFTDAENRCDLLGITKQHYYNKILAKEWFNSIYSIIINYNESDIFMNMYKQTALRKLYELYNHMVED